MILKKKKSIIKSLIESFHQNSTALEMMPYNLIREIEDIEQNLTLSQFAEEEDCHSNIEEVLKKIETWLKNVPIKNT